MKLRFHKLDAVMAAIGALMIIVALLSVFAAPTKAATNAANQEQPMSALGRTSASLASNYGVNNSNGIAVGFFQDSGVWQRLPAGANTEDYFGWSYFKGYAWAGHACVDLWYNDPGTLGWTFWKRNQHYQGGTAGRALDKTFNWKVAVHPNATCPGGVIPLQGMTQATNFVENAPSATVAFGAVCGGCQPSQWARLNPGENTAAKFGWPTSRGIVYAGNAKVRIWQLLGTGWVYVGCNNVTPTYSFIDMGTSYSYHFRVYPNQWC